MPDTSSVRTSEFPFVSIILVCLNAVKTIENTLHSITVLDYPNFEFIVADGVSEDGTIEVLKKYRESIDVLVIERDGGIYDAMNKGVELANGDFIYFIGADDVISNGWKDLAGKLRNENTIYYGNSYFAVSNRIYDGRFSTIKLLFRNICQQSIFYPRSVFNKYRFSEKYPFQADYHLNLILKSDFEFSFMYFDFLVAKFSEKGVSTCNPDHKFQKDRKNLIRKNYSFLYYLLFLWVTALKNLIR